tara:strand:- start:249 stop:875 length:627 start_codon:yes stop_codon:yes gene_type:complete
MKRIIKLNTKQLNNIINRVMIREAKKPKKDKDSKYETWCKDNGWENGVGEGCADAALDSKESSIRSWGLGFLMGSKGKSLNEQRDRNEENEISGLVSDLRYIMDDIINRSSTLEDYKRREIEDDIQSLDHKIAVLWEKVQYYDKGEEYVDYDGEPLVNPSFDDEDETFTKADERRYDDRVNYGTDDESRYDDRNYRYGNHPDDDYWED